MKKTFETPYIKIVRVHNDIIATSLTVDPNKGSGWGSAPERDWDDLDDEYDEY